MSPSSRRFDQEACEAVGCRPVREKESCYEKCVPSLSLAKQAFFRAPCFGPEPWEICLAGAAPAFSAAETSFSQQFHPRRIDPRELGAPP